MRRCYWCKKSCCELDFSVIENVCKKCCAVLDDDRESRTPVWMKGWFEENV